MKLRINRFSGFSLIELLVVISIIAIMLAVLMPSLNKAKQQAIKVRCASQQRDTGVALHMYSQDWDGVLPRAYWSGVEGTQCTWLPYKLAPYVDRKRYGVDHDEIFSFELYSCPAQPKWLKNRAGETVQWGTSGVGSYGYNRFFYFGYDTGGLPSSQWLERKLADIQDPSSLPLYGCLSAEEYMGLGAGGGQGMHFKGPHPMAIKYGFMGGEINWLSKSRTDPWGLAPNHGREANILMGDFSVRGVDVCVDGQFPWFDYVGTAFHPSRASERGYRKR